MGILPYPWGIQKRQCSFNIQSGNEKHMTALISAINQKSMLWTKWVLDDAIGKAIKGATHNRRDAKDKYLVNEMNMNTGDGL